MIPKSEDGDKAQGPERRRRAWGGMEPKNDRAKAEDLHAKSRAESVDVMYRVFESSRTCPLYSQIRIRKFGLARSDSQGCIGKLRSVLPRSRSFVQTA